MIAVSVAISNKKARLCHPLFVVCHLPGAEVCENLHRANDGSNVENTVESFGSSLSRGHDGVLDIRLCALRCGVAWNIISKLPGGFSTCARFC